MRDLGWFPPRPATLKRLKRRRRLRVFGLALLCLGSTAFVVQQFVWKGQRPLQTLPFENAIKVLQDTKELPVKRRTASTKLYVDMLQALDELERFANEKQGNHSKNADLILQQLEKKLHELNK